MSRLITISSPRSWGRGISDGAAGINILLYGTPGTGKTELTKVPAAAAHLALSGDAEEIFAEGETDRLHDLVFSLRLFAKSRATAPLIDRMEDLA